MAATTNFPMPQSIELDESTATDTYSKFVAAPFVKGFGNTIGNSLRRVLLSSLEGAAISAVRIDGATHEYASLDHVVEDITEIILNLKKVKLAVEGNTPLTLEICKDTAGVITAADIVTNGLVEILNPEQIICTLDKNTAFRAEVEVTKGRGYTPSEENKKNEHPLGTIAMDALFSPVTRVRYHVGQARLGEETEMDGLTLEVWTDGRISPTDALEKSSKILKDHLRPFLGSQAGEEDALSQISEEEQKLYKILTQDVEQMDLSVRAMNCLNNANIKLIGELTLKTETRMLKYRNFGKKSLDEIISKLEDMNLSLGMSFSEELTDAINAEADRAKTVDTEEN